MAITGDTIKFPHQNPILVCAWCDHKLYANGLKGRRIKNSRNIDVSHSICMPCMIKLLD